MGEHVRARLVSETDSARPGSTHRLAVLFETDPGWHLYAPYTNDTGLPILLEPRASSGVEVGPIAWPAPRRLVSEGSILDHVYEGETAVIVPVRIPADASPGSLIRLECRAEWLVCGTGCIPGEGTMTIGIPIVPASRPVKPSAHAGAIHRTLERLPRPWNELGGRAVLRPEEAGWRIEVPGALGLAFFPGEQCAKLADPITDAKSRSESLRLEFEPNGEGALRISGTLEVTTKDGVAFYALDSATELP